MPRFENLKGSMNPFSNNRPRLTASERIRNKRDATIYQAEKSKYQASSKCYNGGKNIKYYKNGKVKSTINHDMNQKLARGAVLCEDCDKNGTLCKPLLTQKKNTKINMGNNSLSVLSMDSGIIPSGGNGIAGQPVQKTNVIISDVSGTWCGSSTDISKSLIGPNGTIPGTSIVIPFGYARNLIKIPRNLDGSGIFIDPSNLLFEQDNNCNTKTLGRPIFLKQASINTTIVYTGIIGNMTGAENISGSNSLYNKNNVNEILNNFCVFSFTKRLDSPTVPASIAIVSKICFAGTQIINTIPPNTKFTAEIFKVFFTVSSKLNEPLWQGTIFPPVNGIATNNPSFNPSTIAGFNIKGFDPNVPPFPISFNVTSLWCNNFGPAQDTSSPNQNYGAGATMNIEIQQNNINCSNSQVRQNKTRQSYLSCIEQGTKNIKFTKNTL